MNGLKGIFKGKNNNSSIANALAKNYQKKATTVFKELLKKDSDARLFTGFAISIKSIKFKDKEVEINSTPEKNIYKTKCKSKEELYEKNEFIRPENLIKKGYWFIGRDFEEIQDFLKALEKLNYTIMWKLDEDTNNYILYPVFFVN